MKNTRLLFLVMILAAMFATILAPSGQALASDPGPAYICGATCEDADPGNCYDGLTKVVCEDLCLINGKYVCTSGWTCVADCP